MFKNENLGFAEKTAGKVAEHDFKIKTIKRLVSDSNNGAILLINDYYAPDRFLPIALRKLHFSSSIEEKAITLMRAIETKDPYTRGHSEFVSCYSVYLARELGFDDNFVSNLEIAAYLHDIGKLVIDRWILIKPARLNHTETLIIKKHPEVGVHLLGLLSMPEEIKVAVHYHHERHDGNGYPAGLSGKEIPISSRILALADAFDAMTSDRPYRSRKSLSEAFEEMDNVAGTQFDPELVKIFKKSIQRLLK